MKLRHCAILFGLGAIFAYQPVATYFADGFALSKIQSDLKPDPRWELGWSPEEIQTILSQPFSYLEKGSQCYVFESQDGNYVLKFFRHRRYQPPKWITLFAPRDYLERKRERREELFQSCFLAQEELRESSGLVYLHLNKTEGLNRNVVLHDRLHRRFNIDIDRYEFVIQTKAELIYPHFSRLMEAGEVGKAKEGLLQLLTLLQTRFERGIDDLDAVLTKNSGFLDDRAIFIDIGQFHKNKRTIDYRSETQKITRRLREWLEANHPELAAYLEIELDLASVQPTK